MPSWVRDALKQYVVPFRVSMSQFLANHAEQVVIEAGYKPPNPMAYESISQLILDNFEVLEDSRIPRKRLKEIANGEHPTEIELLRIANIIGTTEDELIELCKKCLNNEQRV
jgi:pyruvate/2-oxoacid:ferredoxin oxidoreductase alpha subunit